MHGHVQKSCCLFAVGFKVRMELKQKKSLDKIYVSVPLRLARAAGASFVWLARSDNYKSSLR